MILKESNCPFHGCIAFLKKRQNKRANENTTNLSKFCKFTLMLAFSSPFVRDVYCINHDSPVWSQPPSHTGWHKLQALLSNSCNLLCSITLIIEIYDRIVTPCFDSLAIRQSPYTKYTSSQYQYAPGFKS